MKMTHGARSFAASKSKLLLHNPRLCCLVFRLTEQVTNTPSTLAHENLVELGSGSMEEWNASLTGDGSREESLAGSRWADQQNSFRQLSTQSREFFGIPEELDDFLQLLLGLVASFDVVE